MKRFIVLTILVLAVAGMLNAQSSEALVNPIVQTFCIDSVKVTISKDTLFMNAVAGKNTGQFTGIDSGMVVYGPGIAEGTIVITNIGDTTLALNLPATATNVRQTLDFGKLGTYTTYISGEWMGLPFLIYNGWPTSKLMTISITDSSDQLGNTDIIFFNTFKDSYGIDTLAVALGGSYFTNVVGYVSCTTAVDLGTTRILEKDNCQMVLPGGKLYGRLIAKSTPKFTATKCLKIRFRFSQ